MNRRLIDPFNAVAPVDHVEHRIVLKSSDIYRENPVYQDIALGCSKDKDISLDHFQNPRSSNNGLHYFTLGRYTRVGNYLALASSDNQVSIVDCTSREMIIQQQIYMTKSAAKGNDISGMCWTRDGRTLMILTSSGLMIWDFKRCNGRL